MCQQKVLKAEEKEAEKMGRKIAGPGFFKKKVERRGVNRRRKEASLSPSPRQRKPHASSTAHALLLPKLLRHHLLLTSHTDTATLRGEGGGVGEENPAEHRGSAA